jgi:hypothetical protein
VLLQVACFLKSSDMTNRLSINIYLEVRNLKTTRKAVTARITKEQKKKG